MQFSTYNEKIFRKTKRAKYLVKEKINVVKVVVDKLLLILSVKNLARKVYYQKRIYLKKRELWKHCLFHNVYRK